MRKALQYLAYLALRAAAGVAWRLPVKPAFGFFGLAGRLAWHVMPGRRRMALDNLAYVMGELPEAEREAIARKSIANIFLGVPEFLLHRKLEKEEWRYSEIEGWENVGDLMESGRGFFMAGGHVGAWCMLWTIPLVFKPGGIVVKRVPNPYVDAYIDRYAAMLGNRRLADRDSAAGILEVVESGGIVGFYMDQAALPHLGKQANFFGKPAYTQLVPFYLALKHGIPMVPIFGIRLGPGHIKIVIRPPLPLEKTENKIEDLVRMAERMNAVIEDLVRQYPDQWIWMHDRWKFAREEKAGGRTRVTIARKISETWD